MANSTRLCKVCGKEYPYCKTELKNGNIFRWQDVACCPEHGSEYFALVAASREETHVAKESAPIVDIIDDDEEDALFEEDFEDDEDDDE